MRKKAKNPALDARAWPFGEARKLLGRFAGRAPEKGHALFETGYGPSGLPHIGTFGEVVRTAMVRRAFEEISDIPTKLVCFSDDLDGLRRVPDNIPNPEKLKGAIGLPLSAVPCPVGEYASFAEANNAKLRAFLDRFGFDYEFISSTECYRSGRFDAILRRALERFDAIMAIMLPTLGPERQATYSPFLPISPASGRVLQVPTLARDAERGTILFRDEDGREKEIPVTGGACKLQWKPDWACRWAALGVDYEMSGKDITDSVVQSGRICRALGARPPEGFTYELFLDGEGRKVSKSRGNGLAMEEWLAYADPESLSWFMYQRPRAARRLDIDVIPKAVDEYHRQLKAFGEQDEAARRENPVWHVHAGKPPKSGMAISFPMLLNLAGVSGAGDARTLWGYIRRYRPDCAPDTHPDLDRAAHYAARYFRERVAPALHRRPPKAGEAKALEALAQALRKAGPAADAEALQSLVYEIGRLHRFEPLGRWFRTLYETLLGQAQGPRFGGFIALYGVMETVALIEEALAGKDVRGESVPGGGSPTEGALA